MLPTINGKDLIDCSLDDLQIILDNPDYMENEYIDYKKTFSVNEVPKEQKQHEQAEFRSDVCSFANANGGYLIFGVKEEKGIAKELLGITLPNNNPDKFELELKNYLQPIKPRVPYYKIKYVEVQENKYIVILFIQHDSFAPYIHLVEQQNYRAFKRSGNSKAVIEYQELKRMFEQSNVIEKEISIFRKDRIDFFAAQEDNVHHDYSMFFMLHIIPDTFNDSNYEKPMFILMKKGQLKPSIFDLFRCNNRTLPSVEGLRFTQYNGNAECRLFNNGVAEVFCPLLQSFITQDRGKYDRGFLGYIGIWESIKDVIYKYFSSIYGHLNTTRFFICISIIGCKGVITVNDFYSDSLVGIDRNLLLCPPVVFQIKDNEMKESELQTLELEFLLSLGIRNSERVNELVSAIAKDQ